MKTALAITVLMLVFGFVLIATPFVATPLLPNTPEYAESRANLIGAQNSLRETGATFQTVWVGVQGAFASTR